MAGLSRDKISEAKPIKQWAFIVVVDATSRVIEDDIHQPLWASLKKLPFIDALEVLPFELDANKE